MAISPKHLTRRELLAGAATLAGGTLLSPGFFSGSAEASASHYDPRLSVQIYVWTQHFESQRKTIVDGVEEALAAIQRAGYGRVELTSDFFRPEVRTKTVALLAKYNLEPATTYAGATMHEAPAAERAIREILKLGRVLKPVGTRWIVTNPGPKPGQARKTDNELNTQARYLNQLGRGLRKQGIGLMIHHHTPELADNAREWRHLLQHTDPSLISCCVDVEWAVRGGQEPLAFLREARNRLASLHLRNSKAGVWMEDFDEGDIDYRQVTNYLKQIGYDGYLVVELAYEKKTAITRPLEEDLRLSRLYAEKVFGL